MKNGVVDMCHMLIVLIVRLLIGFLFDSSNFLSREIRGQKSEIRKKKLFNRRRAVVPPIAQFFRLDLLKFIITCASSVECQIFSDL